MATPPAAHHYSPSARSSPLELMRLKQALETLSEELADDPLVVERHGSRLQVLDVVAQPLGSSNVRCSFALAFR